VDKKTRNLIITIVSIVLIIVVASVVYNKLVDTAPAVSMKPTLVADYTPPAPVAPVVAADEAVAIETRDEDPVRIEEHGEAVVVEEEGISEPAQEETAKVEEDENSDPIMPDIPFYTLDDELTSFDAVRAHRPAIINYFASWCPPCKAELPHFEKAWEQYGDEVAFIFLDALDGQRETKQTITTFIKEFPFRGPVYWDEGIFAYLFQTTSLPTTIFIDRDGRVVSGYLGMISERTLEEEIDRLLK
jgi:thiol-disulfide isomerase/thioredoxin